MKKNPVEEIPVYMFLGFLESGKTTFAPTKSLKTFTIIVSRNAQWRFWIPYKIPNSIICSSHFPLKSWKIIIRFKKILNCNRNISGSVLIISKALLWIQMTLFTACDKYKNTVTRGTGGPDALGSVHTAKIQDTKIQCLWKCVFGLTASLQSWRLAIF